ncbi:MAG: AsmA family protein, partial [Calditrichaeota bacterium]
MSDKKSQNDNGKNIRKRFMKLIVRAGIGFLLLILLILFFLTLPPGETLIRKIAQNQISNILQRPVKIADFSTNLISSIELTGLHIPVEDEDPENTLLGIGRISISYNLWALLHKNIRLKSVDVSGIDLFLQRNEDGTLNLPGIMTANGDTAAKDTSTGGFTFTLEQASVSNSNLHYEDIPASVKISLKTLSLKLRQEQPGHYAIEMSVDSGGTRYREKYFALRKFLADGKVTPEMYQLDTLRLDLTDIILSGDASLSRSTSDAAIDGGINYTINTTAVSDLFRDQIPERIYPVRSHINGRIWLSRTLENPAVETTLEVEGAQLGPDLPFAATAHLVWQKDSLMIRNLAMGIFRGTIIAKGAIKLDTLYQHALNLYLNQVALEELYDYIYAEKSPFQGNIQGSIYSNGPLADLFNINTEVDFTVKKFNYKSRSFPDFNLEMNFRNHRALLKAEQGQSNIRADLNISEEYLSGSYSAEIGHVQPYLALAQIPGVTGSINLDGNISGTLDSPDISMAFSGKNISYRNFPLNRIDGNLDFQKNQLSVRNTTFSGEIGNIDTLKPPFDLPDISGSFSYEGFLEGSPENPRGEVLLSANNFSYRNYQIDRVNVHVKIDSHQVSVSPGHIIRDSLLLSLGGRYDLQE